MQNRPVWFFSGERGHVSPGAGILPAAIDSLPIESIGNLGFGASAQQHARAPRRVSYFSFASTCLAQEASPTPSPGEAEAEQVVVSATRFDIPLDQSPASVSVISSEDLEQKQIQRVSDALREVPGLSVVQTGTAGQLTSVFMRGLPSEDMQVLLDGIPINQGLSGAMNFADITTDDIDRIEVVRGPQSTTLRTRAHSPE